MFAKLLLELLLYILLRGRICPVLRLFVDQWALEVGGPEQISNSLSGVVLPMKGIVVYSFRNRTYSLQISCKSQKKQRFQNAASSTLEDLVEMEGSLLRS